MSYQGLPAGFTVAEPPNAAPAQFHGLPEGFAVQSGDVPKPNSFVDAARSIPGGLGKGIAGMAAAPGLIGDVVGAGMRAIGIPTRDTSQPLPDNVTVAYPQGDPATAVRDLGKAVGGYYEPQTTLGKYTQATAEFAPAALGGEASLANRALTRVLAPAIGSEGAGQAFAGTPYETPARVLGALLAGGGANPKASAQALGEIGGGLSSMVAPAGRAIARGAAARLAEPLAPQDAALVQQYEQMGGHLRPGQYSPSNFMRQGDAVMADTPWPRVSGFAPNSQTAILPAQQSEEFNRMLSRSFGEDAPRLTDDVLQRASARIGRTYDAVLPRNQIGASPDLHAALGQVEQNVAQAAPAMNAPDVVRIQNVLENVRGQLADGGSMPGSVYQAYRQRGGILDELAGSNSPVLQRAGIDIRHALDDAFSQQANEWDAPALQQAKEQYRALETLRPLAAKAPAGNISPGLVLGAVNKEFGSPENAGNLGTLARVGAAFLKAQPSSGTAERSVWRSLINKPFSEGIPAIGNSIASLPISALASRQLNRVVNSPQMRARLLANALQNPGATAQAAQPNAQALAQALQP